jgi:hypothetical protein
MKYKCNENLAQRRIRHKTKQRQNSSFVLPRVQVVQETIAFNMYVYKSSTYIDLRKDTYKFNYFEFVICGVLKFKIQTVVQGFVFLDGEQMEINW